MDDYPYVVLGADGWLRCVRLHHPSFPPASGRVAPLWLHRDPREFGRGHCKFHVDIPINPSNPILTAWFTTATGDDLYDTVERVTHWAITEFCERHLPGLDGTIVSMLPI
jgi:hypothetical protein